MALFLTQLWTADQGQDIAEYAVMLAVILVIVVGTIRLIGSNANTVFSQAASSIRVVASRFPFHSKGERAGSPAWLLARSDCHGAMMSGMTDPFAIQPQQDGTFRVTGLGREPIVISRKQAVALLAWAQADGIQRLRQMLAEGRLAAKRRPSR